MVTNRGIRRVITDFQRHPWLHVISISTVTVALVILGGFFLCSRNFDHLAEKTSPQLTGTLYLKEGVTDIQVEMIKARVSSLKTVINATYKSKSSVVQELQSFLGGMGTETLPSSELFPDVIEVQVRPEVGPGTILALKEEIAKYPEVAEVDFSEDWLAQYRKVRHSIELFGYLLLIAILVGCSFIIANFMGMRHQSRKNEIDIIRLIGGHRNFILTPFLWEGLIEGIAGAFLALIVLYFMRGMLSTLMSVHWTSLLGIREWLYLSFGQILALIAMGVAMAFAGGFTVFLRFQENQK